MSRTLKIVLIIVGVLVVVCCGGGGAVAFSFALDGTNKAPKAATSSFLDALEAGRSEDAYNALCDSTRTTFSMTAFDKAVVLKVVRPPASHDMSWGGSYSNANGVETAGITAKITYKDGSKDSHTFPLRKEGNVWKVCGNPF